MHPEKRTKEINEGIKSGRMSDRRKTCVAKTYIYEVKIVHTRLNNVCE